MFMCIDLNLNVLNPIKVLAQMTKKKLFLGGIGLYIADIIELALTCFIIANAYLFSTVL